MTAKSQTPRQRRTHVHRTSRNRGPSAFHQTRRGKLGALHRSAGDYARHTHWRQHCHQWRMPHRNARRRCGFCADVMHETLQRSSLGALSAGSTVNLEPRHAGQWPLRRTHRVGHIDGTGRITSTRRDDVAVWYDIEAPEAITRYVVEKAPSPLTASASPWRAFPKTASRFR